MELLRQWMLGVVACAILVSVAQQLCPDGAMRNAVRFTGGLLLLLAMLRPAAGLEPAAAGWDADGYREAVARLNRELTEQRENAMERGIAEEWKAYIEDKAESLGAEISAEVEMGARTDVPERVTLRGAYDETLSDFLTAGLGIAKEDLTWIEDG